MTCSCLGLSLGGYLPTSNSIPMPMGNPVFVGGIQVPNLNSFSYDVALANGLKFLKKLAKKPFLKVKVKNYLDGNLGKPLKPIDKIADIKKVDDIVPCLNGKKIVLPNIRKTIFTYVNRSKNDKEVLRNLFNNKERKKNLEKLGENEKLLNQKGFSESDIMKIKDGKVPKGYQVHHKYPLDDGGNNDFDNLVLIKNDPYHKALTNYQNTITKDLSDGNSKVITWYVMDGCVYP